MQPIVVKPGILVVMTMNIAILCNVTPCNSSPPPSEQKMGIVPASEISEPIYHSTQHYSQGDRSYMKMYGEVQLEFHSILILALDMP
jgi:hypothetical protein